MNDNYNNQEYQTSNWSIRPLTKGSPFSGYFCGKCGTAWFSKTKHCPECGVAMTNWETSGIRYCEDK